MSLLEDFKTRYPSFDDTTIDGVWSSIDPAYRCYYGVDYNAGTTCDNEIILVLCAHLFTVQTSSGNSPNLVQTSKAVGNVSTSYGAGEVSVYRSFFISSKYGQQFMQMTNAQANGAIFV